MFCSKCGKKLKADPTFCHHCGTAVTNSHRPIFFEWDMVASSLTNGSLSFAKVLMWVFGGGVIFTCGCSALGLLLTACYLIYHFAKGLSVAAPLFITKALSITTINGVELLLSGIMSAFIAMLLIMAASALMISILSVKKVRRRKYEN